MMKLWNVLSTSIDSLNSIIEFKELDLTGEIRIVKSEDTYKVTLICFRGSKLIHAKTAITLDNQITLNLLFGYKWLE